MTGRIRQVKPNAAPSAIRDFLNDRIRFLMDSQPFWADLVSRGVLSMPAAYTAGTITLTNGSVTVTGTGTSWATNDISNTTIPLGIPEKGVLTVAPASMAGIVTDSFLYIDAGGTPEAVAVLETTPTTFAARFTSVHNQNCAVTQSSLAGLQLKLGATYPVFTVRAVHSSTELETDIAWGTTTLTGASYQLLKCYFSIAPDLKDILNVWDAAQGRPLLFHKPQDWLNVRDPQRQATGFPMALVDHSPSEGGSMQYELWPHQPIAYQVPILYARQWPMLKNPTDRPPSFINPSCIIDGAIADALRIRNSATAEMPDPYFDPKTAAIYEAKFQAEMQASLNANESKMMTVYQTYSDMWSASPGGSYWQSHVSDLDSDGFYW
jgi:hypothetical protein